MATASRTKARVSKAEQARATRGRIVVAATELFLRDGFVTTTMSMIAKEAGVAVQTLYISFGSKIAILHETFDTALRGDSAPDDIPEQSWFQQILTETDGRAALRLACTHARDIIVRVAPLYQVMRAAAADPDVAELLARNKKLRYESFTAVRDALITRAGYAANLDPDDALAIFCTIVSEDTYLLLVTEHGWTVQRWQEWITETVVHQFFPER